MLTQRDVVVDPVLSNISIKYSNTQLVWSRLFPVFSVKKESGVYYKYDKSNLKVAQTRRAGGSPSNEVGYGVDTASFRTEDHALKEFVEDQVQDQADQPLNPLMDATEDVTERLELGAEKGVADMITDTSVVTNNITLSGTDQWSDYTNSDPIGDIRTGMDTVQKSILKRPNTIVMSKPVFDQLQDHPDILDRIKYSQLGATTEDLLGRLLNIDNVIVAEAIENTASEGTSDSLAYVWGKDVVIAYVAPSKRLKQVTLGWTFVYNNRQTMRWRDEDRKGTYVRT